MTWSGGSSRRSGSDAPARRFATPVGDDLIIKVNEFALVKPADLSSPKLRQLIKPFDDIERTLSEAHDALASALPFLSSDNLAMLVRWIPDTHAPRRRRVEQWMGSKAF